MHITSGCMLICFVIVAQAMGAYLFVRFEDRLRIY